MASDRQKNTDSDNSSTRQAKSELRNRKVHTSSSGSQFVRPVELLLSEDFKNELKQKLRKKLGQKPS